MNVKRVTSVLLTDGEWYEVAPGSLDLNQVWVDDEAMAGSISWRDGFKFKTTKGDFLAGPVSSIVLIAYQPELEAA